MKKLEHHIGYLLYEHNCVIVPGFGGFLGQYQPSNIHPTQHTFSPPSKKIAFNRSLQTSDGLLTVQITQAENIGFDEAARYITIEIANWNALLEQHKKLPLDKIGVLFFDVEKNLCFEPDTSVNYLTDSFGFPVIQSLPIKREEAKQLFKKEKDAVVLPLKPKKTRRAFQFPWKVAAAVLLLVGAAEVTWVSFRTGLLNKDKFNLAYMNPFSDSSWFHTLTGNEVSIAPKLEAPKSSTLPQARWESKPDSVESPVQALEEPATAVEAPIDQVTSAPLESSIAETKNETGSSGSGKYLVVAGCFQIEENAQKLLKILREKGYPASIQGKTRRGLTIVTYNSFDAISEARALLEQVKSKEDTAAWLFAN